MIKEVREIAKKDFDNYSNYTWKCHILPVIKYSKILAQKLGEDEEIIELVALLHDIGRARHGTSKNHEITSAEEAEKILTKLNYDKEKIEIIKRSILRHTAVGKEVPETVLEKIIANADAMAHFDSIPFLMMIALKENDNDLTKAFEWLYKKIETNWNNKLSLPEAKEMVKEKYKATKLLLDAMKETIEK